MKSGFDAGRFVTVRNARISEQHKNFKTMTEANAVNKLFDICKLYQKVKPALLTAKRISFFMPKLQKTLQLFITTLDTLCPSE